MVLHDVDMAEPAPARFHETEVEARFYYAIDGDTPTIPPQTEPHLDNRWPAYVSDHTQRPRSETVYAIPRFDVCHTTQKNGES